MNPQDSDYLYYEAHVTIEPVFDEALSDVVEISKRCGFKVADLLMKKRVADTPALSQYDTFTTGRSIHYDAIRRRTIILINLLQVAGYNVLRYKIEGTLLDSRVDDCFELLTA